MERNDALAAAQAALLASTDYHHDATAERDAFDSVYIGFRRSLKGVSPVALIHGTSGELRQEARDLYELRGEIAVDILVKADPDYEEDAENRIFELVKDAMRRLNDADFTNIRSRAIGGAPLLAIDRIYYRAERITAQPEADDI